MAGLNIFKKQNYSKIHWNFLTGGSINHAYLSDDGEYIFKMAYGDVLQTDTPERSVRLWNLINRDLKPKAEVVTVMIEGQPVKGWVCPYIRSRHIKKQSTVFEEIAEEFKTARHMAIHDPAIIAEEDQLLVDALMDVYNRTQRVIMDASVQGNFVITPSKQVVCIDIGMALKLDAREENYFESLTRRNSVSESAWKELRQDMKTGVLDQKNPIYPKTLIMTKALLFIREERPDITHVDFLKNHLDDIECLANAYDDFQLYSKGQAILEKAQPITLKGLKQSCDTILSQYVRSRGKLDENDNFVPSMMTHIFRNRKEIKEKVQQAMILIQNIHAAHSTDEIETLIRTAVSEDEKRPKKLFGTAFRASLGNCLLNIKLPLSPQPEQTDRTSLLGP